MENSNQKKDTPIAEGISRPRHISPKPENGYWLEVSALEAAFAWRITKTTIEDLESRAAFSHMEPMRADWMPWSQFRGEIGENDEIWIYKSPRNFWKIGMGSWGLVRTQDDTPVGFLRCAFN